MVGAKIFVLASLRNSLAIYRFFPISTAIFAANKTHFTRHFIVSRLCPAFRLHGRAPTVSPPTPACTTSQTVVGATANATAHHPHNRTSNSPATVRIAASTSDICFAPRSAHSHHLTPVPFRAQHSAVTAQTPHHSALNPTPSPYKPSPFNAISYASPFRTETRPPTRHAPFVTTQSESFGSVFRTGGNIISVFILRIVVPPFRPPNERRTISVLATNGSATLLKHDSYIIVGLQATAKKHRPR